MSKKSLFFALLNLVLLSSVFGQTKETEVLPIIKMHPKPIVELMLNGQKSSFLVDTGSDITILNLKDAKKYDFKTVLREGRHQVTGMGGGSSSMSETWDVILGTKGRRFLSSFLSYDLSTIVRSIRNKTGLTISGILGADVMKKYGFIIDFAGRQITIPQQLP